MEVGVVENDPDGEEQRDHEQEQVEVLVYARIINLLENWAGLVGLEVGDVGRGELLVGVRGELSEGRARLAVGSGRRAHEDLI